MIEITPAWLDLFHTVYMASLRASTGGPDAVATAEKAGLTAVAEKIDAQYRLSDDRHLVKVADGEDGDGWTVQHPLSCRPNLFTCPWSDPDRLHWGRMWDRLEPEPSTPGYVYVGGTIVDNDAPEGLRLVLGERVEGFRHG